MTLVNYCGSRKFSWFSFLSWLSWIRVYYWTQPACYIRRSREFQQQRSSIGGAPCTTTFEPLNAGALGNLSQHNSSLRHSRDSTRVEIILLPWKQLLIKSFKWNMLHLKTQATIGEPHPSITSSSTQLGVGAIVNSSAVPFTHHSTLLATASIKHSSIPIIGIGGKIQGYLNILNSTCGMVTHSLKSHNTNSNVTVQTHITSSVSSITTSLHSPNHVWLHLKLPRTSPETGRYKLSWTLRH